MKIAIGCDHVATDIKNKLITILEQQKHTVIDCGTYSNEKTHYPIYGFEVGRQVATKKADIGIVICGTGIGIANAVNKVKGVRAVLTKDICIAQIARQQYNANVIACGGIIGIGPMQELIMTFINTKYIKNNNKVIKKIDNFIKKDNYNTKQFDLIIKKWVNGEYTEGEKMPSCDIPKTWK